MSGTGAFYLEQGIRFFESGNYEQAVQNMIQAYGLGYEQEWILENIRNCFIQPNEQEFRDYYRQGSAEFVQIPFEECALDFIPVCENRYYIFDKEQQEFSGLFVMDETPVCGKDPVYESILYTDTWDFREVLPDMKQYQRPAVYILPEKQEARFASFFQLPHFKERYLRNVIVFKNEMLLRRFFEASFHVPLPGEIVTDEPKRYWNLLLQLHSKRISGFLTAELETVFQNPGKDGKEEEKEAKGLDGIVMRAQRLFCVGQKAQAYTVIKEAVRINPYNFMVNRMARLLSADTGDDSGAVKYDTILKFLHDMFPELPCVDAWTRELMGKLHAQHHIALAQGDETRALKYKDEIDFLKGRIPVAFGFDDHTYDKGSIVGKIYEDGFGNRWYNARCDAVSFEDILPDVESAFDNCVLTKMECLAVTRTNSFLAEGDTEYLLPVLQEKTDIPYKFTTADGLEYICKNKKPQHFEYYRLQPQTKLESEMPLFVGKPILLKQDAKKKKLVLNIFVDGLSQKVIEEEGLANLMPFTAQFFSKGVCVSNAYTAGEWTLPSLASYTTGLSTADHMLIHDRVTHILPEDVTVLAEYFKEQGYQTAKIDGDWRSNLLYGYGRGMDRVVYQYQDTGLKAAQVVENVLDHMELMKETNQFIWMCVGDLHNIADGYALHASVQAAIPLEKRCVEEAGVTSVKQYYSCSKRTAYIQQIKYIDRCLLSLYSYIERNYEDEEIVVSMFGDHGQGYLVREDEHFLAEGRTKVGMMFRGGMKEGGVCEELVSTCDYLPILCQMAGIPLKDEKIEGRLPRFFGGSREREYVITESVHLNDPYYAAIYGKDEVFYFTSGGLASYDGRFGLGDYQCMLLDRQGRECQDKERWDYYFHILMQHVEVLQARREDK